MQELIFKSENFYYILSFIMFIMMQKIIRRLPEHLKKFIIGVFLVSMHIATMLCPGIMPSYRNKLISSSYKAFKAVKMEKVQKTVYQFDIIRELEEVEKLLIAVAKNFIKEDGDNAPSKLYSLLSKQPSFRLFYVSMTLLLIVNLMGNAIKVVFRLVLYFFI